MTKGNAAAIFLKIGDGISAAGDHPVDIEFVIDRCRIRISQHVILRNSPLQFLERIPVTVIGEAQTVFPADLSAIVELISDPFKIVQRFLRPDPGTDQVTHPDLTGLRGLGLKIGVYIAMTRYHGQADLIQVFFKISMAHSPEQTQIPFVAFDLLIAERSDLLQYPFGVLRHFFS